MQHASEFKQHSKSAVEEVVHALAWLHRVAGMESPHEIIITVCAGGMRCTLSKPKGSHVPSGYDAEILFSMAESSHTPGKLFRGTGAGERLRNRNGGGLSYSRLRGLLLAKIEQLGMNPRQFGMH